MPKLNDIHTPVVSIWTRIGETLPIDPAYLEEYMPMKDTESLEDYATRLSENWGARVSVSRLHQVTVEQPW